LCRVSNKLLDVLDEGDADLKTGVIISHVTLHEKVLMWPK